VPWNEMKIAGVLATAFMATGLQAGPYDGAFLIQQCIEIGGDTCTSTRSRDVWFLGDRYNPAGDFECQFRNPVTVRDLNAVLCDVECFGGDQQGVFRETTLSTEDGLIRIGNWGAGELVKCG